MITFKECATVWNMSASTIYFHQAHLVEDSGGKRQIF